MDARVEADATQSLQHCAFPATVDRVSQQRRERAQPAIESLSQIVSAAAREATELHAAWAVLVTRAPVLRAARQVR